MADIHQALDFDTKRKLVLGSGRQLMERLEISTTFMILLVQHSVLRHSQSMDIRALQTPTEQKYALIKYLSRCSVEQFFSFCEVLCTKEINRKDIITDVLKIDIDCLTKQADDGGGVNCDKSPGKKKLTEGLSETMSAHCMQYKNVIMRGRVFDFKHEDAASVMYNMLKCYISLNPQVSEYHRITTEIEIEKILKPFADSCEPKKLLLEGQPGTGKSTLFRYLTFYYSLKLLEHLSRDPVNEGGAVVWLPVYIHSRSLTTDLWDSIQQQISACSPAKYPVIDMMKRGILNIHVKLIVLLDAIDELRDEEILCELRKFICDVQSIRGMYLIVSSRTGLSRMDNSLFDRFLRINGFTMGQGLEYTHRYIVMYSPSAKALQNAPLQQDVNWDAKPEIYTNIERKDSTSKHCPYPHDGHCELDYVDIHKDRLLHLLQNPLRVHLLSALAVEGLLELDNDHILQFLDLMRTTEDFFVERETEGKGIPEIERYRFYRMCLWGLLKDIREFSQEHLSLFNIPPAYTAFLTMSIKRDKRGKSCMCFSFEHELMYEFFASRGIMDTSADVRQALILIICSNDMFRNLQKLLLTLLNEYPVEQSVPLMAAIVKVLLIKKAVGDSQISQYDNINLKDPAIIDKCTALLRCVRRSLPSPTELLLKQDSIVLQAVNINEMWNDIQDIFCMVVAVTANSHSYHNKCLMEEFFGQTCYLRATVKAERKQGFVPTIIQDLLSDCTCEQQESVAKETYLRLMPCAWFYPSITTRWGYTSETVTGNRYIWSWSPVDLKALTNTFFKTNPSKETTERLDLYFTDVPLVWGRVPDNHWGCDEWVAALKSITSHYEIFDELYIKLDDKLNPPLQGLLKALVQLAKSTDLSCNLISIENGTFSFPEPSQARHWQNLPWKIKLLNTNIEVPEVEIAESLIHCASDKLLREIKGGKSWYLDEVSFVTNYGYVAHQIQSWTPLDLQKLMRQYKQSHPNREIATELDIHITKPLLAHPLLKSDMQWSCDQWRAALMAVTEQYKVLNKLDIHLDKQNDPNIQNLLLAIDQMGKEDFVGKFIYIHHGCLCPSDLGHDFRWTVDERQWEVELVDTEFQLPEEDSIQDDSEWAVYQAIKTAKSQERTLYFSIGSVTSLGYMSRTYLSSCSPVTLTDMINTYNSTEKRTVELKIHIIEPSPFYNLAFDRTDSDYKAWAACFSAIMKWYHISLMITIYLARDTSLKGLLQALSELSRFSITVNHGKITLSDLYDWYQVYDIKHQSKLDVRLYYVSIELPADEHEYKRLIDKVGDWAGNQLLQDMEDGSNINKYTIGENLTLLVPYWERVRKHETSYNYYKLTY